MTANPTLLSMPLAQNGQKNVLPATQATAGDGLFSQSTGFPAETSLPLGAGGVAPSREDFNGLANLLGGVAFMAQKGFTFNYSATQDYYTGCVVIDTTDGKRYECIADMTAGTIAPHNDTLQTYWKIFTTPPETEKMPLFNKRTVISTSGTFSAPVTGWYRITVKGGGGGGGGGYTNVSGGGGGEGGTTIAYERMTAGATASVTIGAGGTGGTKNASAGTNGGNTYVVVNSNTYTGGGGYGGNKGADRGADGYCKGGSGTIVGASGQSATGTYADAVGSVGGGAGGAVGYSGSPTSTTKVGFAGVNGGGGAGGAGSTTASYCGNGGAGGNGYAWFEYYDISLNP